MCGLAGFWQDPASVDADVGHRMSTALEHRGPDARGVWVDESAGIVLVHTRLAIIDLSPAGHQPMHSPSGRYVLVYNGEIYNFVAIRKELEALGSTFNGHSDTEVFVHALERWGVRSTLQRCQGMLAAAIWDRRDRCLYLARDRMGKKPLYYGRSNGTLLFGSELKALRCHPAFTGEIDAGALSLYRRFNHVPAPFSIYKDIRKLPPGSFVRIPERTMELPAPEAYWTLAETIDQARSSRATPRSGDPVDQLETVLSAAVEERLQADVPLGALLSGGIDSSLVVALMQRAARGRVRTFTVGFREAAFDESDAAAQVARHLGTEHTQLFVTPQDAIDVIGLMPRIYDEPFADSSQVPTYLLCRMIREHVTVALSGDGGDELFGGYARYRWADNIWSGAGRLPAGVRQLAGSAFRGIDRSFAGIVRGRAGRAAELLGRVGRVFSVGNREEAYIQLVSNWGASAHHAEPRTVHRDPAAWPHLDNYLEWMMYLDAVSYLPDDVLVKVDRASMAVSLELRAPLLDTRVVEFAWGLPLDLRVRKGQPKWILRALLERYVPRPLFERPKMGFGIPFETWLRGPLREWAESLLAEGNLDDRYTDVVKVRRQWREHLAGRNWTYDLWNALMFEAWRAETNVPTPSSGFPVASP